MSKPNRPSPQEIVFAFPKELDGKPVERVTMRPPKGSDSVAAGSVAKNPAEGEMILISNLCGLTPDFILEMELCDVNQLQEALSNFLSIRPKLPAKSS